MKLTKRDYQAMAQEKAPKSPLWKDVILAAVIGGLICCVGQAVGDFWKSEGLDQDSASAATSITMIALGAALTALHLYDKIAKYGGAGTLVPITGFANAITAPAMEFKTEGLILGLAAKMFVIAGPVLVYGIGASVIYGFLLFWL